MGKNLKESLVIGYFKPKWSVLLPRVLNADLAKKIAQLA